jgi:hypothetical protein
VHSKYKPWPDWAHRAVALAWLLWPCWLKASDVVCCSVFLEPLVETSLCHVLCQEALSMPFHRGLILAGCVLPRSSEHVCVCVCVCVRAFTQALVSHCHRLLTSSSESVTALPAWCTDCDLLSKTNNSHHQNPKIAPTAASSIPGVQRVDPKAADHRCSHSAVTGAQRDNSGKRRLEPCQPLSTNAPVLLGS